MAQPEKVILYTRSEIARRVKDLADQISRDYAGSDLLLIGVLKGAFMFMADLARAMSIPCQTDFIRAASYGAGSESSGTIVITKDVDAEIQGRDILIIEDIVDTGLTLRHIVDTLKLRKPNSIRVCAFLDKRGRRKIPFEADYVGFSMEDGFVVGYGLDFNEQDRHWPDVYVIPNPV
ncbi:MAG: hypoxanthine phosphoribosyltransferase [Smithellaceae bacterium]|nr:hypoxanthine phosphoribosyltransferase [Syntrophaceae bacterium]MDD4240355.1 hypoxanthine phosphoribosyltransferase [Smithellaceae bacterium]NLX52140.1 hypoxanthine phosphoribosyltransferase [Deltaproteobacteria bacterium]